MSKEEPKKCAVPEGEHPVTWEDIRAWLVAIVIFGLVLGSGYVLGHFVFPPEQDVTWTITYK